MFLHFRGRGERERESGIRDMGRIFDFSPLSDRSRDFLPIILFLA